MLATENFLRPVHRPVLRRRRAGVPEPGGEGGSSRLSETDDAVEAPSDPEPEG